MSRKKLRRKVCIIFVRYKMGNGDKSPHILNHGITDVSGLLDVRLVAFTSSERTELMGG